MPVVKLNKATHIYAEVGAHAVSEAECARLCALGIAEPVEEQKAPAQEEKKTKKKAGK